jgi:hypothetical protein
MRADEPGEGATVASTGDIGRRVVRLVEGQPLLSVAAAGVIGVALGGVVFAKLGRLAFAAAVGYVANDLWHRQGGLDVNEVLHEFLP